MKVKFFVCLTLVMILACSISQEKRRKNAEPYYRKAWEFKDQGAFVDAITNFQKAIEIYPEFIEAHMDYQEMVSADKVPDTLLERYRKLLDNNKKNCIYYFLYGRLLADPDDQDREYRKALMINQNCEWAYYGLGYTAFDRQKFDDAVGYYKKAIEIDNKNPRFHGNLGGIYFYKGLYPEAEEELKKAIELDPQYPVFYYNLFALYYQKGDYDLAIKMLDKYAQVDPYAKNIGEARTKLKQLRGY